MADNSRLTLLLFAVTCACDYVEAVRSETPPHNPPRTQDEIQKRSLAACKNLRGQLLKDCMQNYVGTQKESKYLDTYDAATPPAASAPIEGNQSGEDSHMPHGPKAK